MRTNLPFIVDRMNLNLAESGTEVTLRWVTVTGATPDEVTGAMLGGTKTPASEVVKAFVHFVQVAASSTVRLFNEIEVGDVIVDFAPDVVLTGREQLVFEIGGERYVQKEIGSKLATSWDAIVQGVKLYQPVLLRKAT